MIPHLGRGRQDRDLARIGGGGDAQAHRAGSRDVLWLIRQSPPPPSPPPQADAAPEATRTRRCPCSRARRMRPAVASRGYGRGRPACEGRHAPAGGGPRCGRPHPAGLERPGPQLAGIPAYAAMRHVPRPHPHLGWPDPSQPPARRSTPRHPVARVSAGRRRKHAPPPTALQPLCGDDLRGRGGRALGRREGGHLPGDGPAGRTHAQVTARARARCQRMRACVSGA